MGGVQEIPRGASTTSYFSSLNAIGGYRPSSKSHIDSNGSGGVGAGGDSNVSDTSNAGSKRKRVNYSQAALEAQAYAANLQVAEEENLSEAQIQEIKRQKQENQQRDRLRYSVFLSPAEEKAAQKRLDELDRENYNDHMIKFEIPRNLYVKNVKLHSKDNRNDNGEDADDDNDEGDDDDNYGDDDDEEDDETPRPKSKQNVVVPLSAAVKRLLLSRKTMANYYDEIDHSKWNKLKLLESIPDFQTQKKLCTICGNLSPSVCIKCDSRVCSVRCMRTHNETRCNY